MKVTFIQGRPTTFDELKGGEFFVEADRVTNEMTPDAPVFVRLGSDALIPNEVPELLNAVEITRCGLLHHFSPKTRVKPVTVEAITLGWDMTDRNELPF